MAEDGTIFEKEIACEKYENNLESEADLKRCLLENKYLIEYVDTFIYDVTEMVQKYSMASNLINFINSIGEQDADKIK